MSAYTLLLVVALTSVFAAGSAQASTRRERRHADAPGAGFAIPERIVDNTVHYNANDRAATLHRKAINAFHAGQFETSEACFSLAYTQWPGSKALIEDYAICTSLFPARQRSEARARQLLKDLLEFQKVPSDKALLARALLLAREDKLPESREVAATIGSRRIRLLVTDLVPAMIMQNDTRIRELLSRVLREQKSPAESRINPVR